MPVANRSTTNQIIQFSIFFLAVSHMAAILSTLSIAAGHGSAGAIIIAGSGLPPRSARGRPGDDITGDKAVRELIARTKGHYY